MARHGVVPAGGRIANLGLAAVLGAAVLAGRLASPAEAAPGQPATAARPANALERLRAVSYALGPKLASQQSFRRTERPWNAARIPGVMPEFPPDAEVANALLPLSRRGMSQKPPEPLGLFYPASLGDPFVVEGEGVRVALRRLDAANVAMDEVDGKLVYEDAHLDTDVVYTAAPDWAEELIWLGSPQAPTRFDYEIVDAASATSIRIEGGAVYFTNEARQGLVLSPPVVLDSDGHRSATAARWVLSEAGAANGGARRLTLLLNASGLVYPLAIDPGWSMTGSLTMGRSLGSVVLLQSGKVFFVSGSSGAELYDSTTGVWTAAAPPPAGMLASTATLLRTGRVLVIGGAFTVDVPAPTCHLYDPATDSWSPTGSLSIGRYGHAATLLEDGRVLVTGGQNPLNVSVASAEIYDPGTGVWTSAGSMSEARADHSATLLADGRVLVAAGHSPIVLDTAEIFDPATGSWSPTGSLSQRRTLHTATLLPNGRVLAVGGSGWSATRPELYDPATGLWSLAADSVLDRGESTATLLPNGRVLVVGGIFNAWALSGTEIYNSVSNTWAAAGNLASGRFRHNAVLLPTGKVLVVGGWSETAVLTTELYDPDVGAWSATGTMASGVYGHTAIPLLDGSILVAGGHSLGATSQRYDPTSGTWSSEGPFPARRGHTATLLRDGRVLVVGGESGGPVLATAMLYDPMTRTWSFTGSMANGRLLHTATLLPCGRVLVVGGDDYTTNLASTEMYDPVAGSWSLGPSLHVGRLEHQATLLADGRVLVTGGASDGGIEASAEVFDGGSWAVVGSMLAARRYHTQTLLPNGRVLVTGGDAVGPTLQSAELFDPATGTWSGTANLLGRRERHVSTLLLNGRVLVTGGWSSVSGGILASSELYDPAAGTFSSTVALALGRDYHSSTLLPDGRVLVAGGMGMFVTYIDSAEIYDVGRGEDPAWRPVLSGAAEPMVEDGPLQVTGSGFRGISEASSGNGAHQSETNYPLLHLQRVDNDATRWLPVDPFAGWSDTSFMSAVVTGLQPGPTRVTVVTNGIPSVSRMIRVECIAPLIAANPAGRAACAGDTVLFSVTATGACPSFRWRRNGTPLSDGGRLSGSYTSSLTITSVETGDAGSYDVVVQSPCSSTVVTSAAASLTVAVQTAVADLSVTSVAYDSVSLAWSAVGASSYEVFRSDTSGGPYTSVGSTAGTGYTDETVASGRTYYYVVRAQGTCLSADSNEVSADTPPIADLVVTKTAQDEIVAPGAAVIYTVTVRNAGPNVATAVSLVDDLPAGTVFVTATVAPAGSCSYDGGMHDVTCTLGDLAVDASAEVTIEVTAPGTAGDIVNTATASSVVDEPAPIDRDASVTTIVYEMAVVNEALSFTATTRTGTQETRLEWLNPDVAEYVRTYVRFGTDPTFLNCIPPDPTGGTLLTSQSRIGDYDSYLHDGQIDDTVYCYSVFVHWGAGRLSREKTVKVRPVAAVAGQRVVWAFSGGETTLSPPGFGAGVYMLGQGVYPMLYGASRGAAGGERLAGWDHVALSSTVQHRPVTVPVLGTRLTLLAGNAVGAPLRAVDGTSGAPVWTSASLGPLLGGPSAWLATYGAARDLILTGTRKPAGAPDDDNALYAHDPTLHDTMNPPDPSNAVWTIGAPLQVGAINGGPSLDYAAERVFFATLEHPSNPATVWCARLPDGVVQWSLPYGNITGTPSLRRGRVYVGNDQGVVYALDASNGSEVWRYDTHAVVLDGGVNGTVFVDRLGDDVYFATSSRVWSLSEIEGIPVTASLNWFVNAASPSPPLLHTGTDYLYFGSIDGRLHQVDIATGTEFSVPLGDGAATVGTPAIDSPSSLVYVGTEPGVVHAVALPLD